MDRQAHLESLISRIEELRGRFGRASSDLDAICSRARSSDFRGVLQNARVVVETLLRSILHKEKKETPGKDTLEKLIPKLFQEGQSSILPVAIVVHVRTIQAWGNVGAHDQHADLFEKGLEVKQDEALAALNSLVAILDWYQEKYLRDGSTVSSPVPPVKSSPSLPSRPAPAKSKMPIMAAIGFFAVAGIGGALFVAKNSASQTDVIPAADPTEARADLNREYLSAHEYPPPKPCETNEPEALALFTEATRLLDGGKPGGNRAEDAKALASLVGEEPKLAKSAEYWHLKARALHFTGAPDASVREAADKSIELCKTFAPPYNLHGTLGLLADEVGFAKLSYEKAVELAPDYLSPAFNLGLVHLKGQNLEEAIAAFSAVLKKDPEYTIAYKTRAQAHLAKGSLEAAAGDLVELLRRMPEDAQSYALLGTVRAKLGQNDAARVAFCKAKELGLESAAKMCE
jgi:tetratricopeptide (TPR) repeat protein